MYENYLGVDLHLKRTYLVLMDAQGTMKERRALPTDSLGDYAAGLPDSTIAVLEATRNWQYAYDLLAEHVDQVELVHPKKVKAIASAKIKTDKIDAATLAHLARADLLPTAYAPPQHIRQGRALVRHRAKMVRDRARAKNRVHGLLAQKGIRSPVSDLFGKQGRAFLDEVASQLDSVSQAILADHLALIDALSQRIEVSEEQITPFIEAHPELKANVALLSTIPGVATYSALLILTEVGDIHRFPDPKHLCSYAGLVPSTYQSGEVARHGRITKEGSPWLRWIMVEAAIHAGKYSSRLGRYYQGIKGRHGKKTARVATARKLLTIIYHMLIRQEPYRESTEGQSG